MCVYNIDLKPLFKACIIHCRLFYAKQNVFKISLGNFIGHISPKWFILKTIWFCLIIINEHRILNVKLVLDIDTVRSKTNTTDYLRLLKNEMSFRYNNHKTL